MKKMGLMAAVLLVTGCGLSASDQVGIYVDQSTPIVIDHSAKKIHFSDAENLTADQLLAEIKDGKGMSYSTWRNQTSCGLKDTLGNVFLVPRKAAKLEFEGLTYEVTEQPDQLKALNGNKTLTVDHISVYRKDELILSYGYDKSLGLRYLDRVEGGDVNSRIWLENGVGFLGHCRGFDLNDYVDVKKYTEKK